MTHRRQLLVCLLTLLAGCLPPVFGNGKFVSEPRDVAAFRRLEVNNSIQVTARPGNRAVSVSGDSNLVALVQTRVVGETLVIEGPSSLSNFLGRLEVSVSNDVLEGLVVSDSSTVTMTATPAPRFEAAVSGSSTATLIGARADVTSVTASGSSTLKMSELIADGVELRVGGSSNVELAGTARAANVTVEGSSSASLQRLDLQTLTVNISGSSSVRAKVRDSVSGSVSGASTLRLEGSASRAVTVSGDSSIE